MSHSDNDICSFSFHFWNKLRSRCGNIFNGDFVLQINLIPFHDLWSNQADQSNLNRLFCTITVFYCFRYDNKRIKGIRAIHFIYVRIHIIKICTGS
ncbi:hypothetical protein D3C71_1836780 [compost metagenome]